MNNGERRQIFEHVDSDGDKLDVGEWVCPNGTARLIVDIETRATSEFAEVGLDRADVLRLRSALDTWLNLHSPASSDADVWGTRIPCTRCGHAEGVHTSVHGCGAVANDGYECGCTEYTGGAS